jgi:ferric-dicitrate binding protein FerR (iron transport regulator)
MKIFHRHVSHLLTLHIDHALGARAAQRVERHLAQCPRCRDEHKQIQVGMAVLDNLSSTKAPDAIWTAIEAALPRHLSARRSHRWREVLAYLAIVALAGTAYWKSTQRSEAHWAVTQVRGRPIVDSKPVRGGSLIEAGEWIETDPSSSATVKIGEIGSVEIAPRTRLLAIRMRSDQHRLALARGQIRAKISAPPKLFFVDTAAGTAVDLGCEYSLQTNEHGSGLLQVTKGWVSFEWKGVESLVPAGASCRTRPGNGPGVPYFDDAAALFKQAVESFAMDKSGAALDTILSSSRLRDTLTLWHLLFRVSLPERKRVYDRIAELTPVPADVTREKVMKLDAATLSRWKDELAWTW